MQRDSHVNGRRAIRITALQGRGIVYVQPGSYRLLEFVTMGDPGAGPRSTAWMVMRFDAYATLPRASASPPNLERLHPNAKLVS